VEQSAGDGRQETPLERVDRNLEELTGELRRSASVRAAVVQHAAGAPA